MSHEDSKHDARLRAPLSGFVLTASVGFALLSCACAPSELAMYGAFATEQLELDEHLARERADTEERPPPPGPVILFPDTHDAKPERYVRYREDITSPAITACPVDGKPQPEFGRFCAMTMESSSGYGYAMLSLHDDRGRLVSERSTRGDRIEVAYDGPHYDVWRREWEVIDNTPKLTHETIDHHDAHGRLASREERWARSGGLGTIWYQYTYGTSGALERSKIVIWRERFCPTSSPPPCEMAQTLFYRHRVRADGAIERLVSVDRNRDGKPDDDGRWRLDEVTPSEVGISVALERTIKSRAIERTGSRWHRYGGETNYITFDYNASGELTGAARYISSKFELRAQIERRCDGFDVVMRTSHKPDEVFARFRFTGGACELDPERIDWMMRQFFVKTLL